MSTDEKQIYVSPAYFQILALILAQGLHPKGTVVRFTDFGDFLRQVKDLLPKQNRQGAIGALVREELRMMQIPEEEIIDVRGLKDS